MPSIRTADWPAACALGATIIAAFGAACLYVSARGGPSWLSGEELAIFLKLSALTVAVVVADIAWKMKEPQPEQATVEGGSHFGALPPIAVRAAPATQARSCP